MKKMKNLRIIIMKLILYNKIQFIIIIIVLNCNYIYFLYKYINIYII